MGGRHVTLVIEGFWNIITLIVSQKKAFNSCQEDRTIPPPLTGEQVYNQVCQVEVTYGKPSSIVVWKTYERRNRYSLNFHIGQS